MNKDRRAQGIETATGNSSSRRGVDSMSGMATRHCTHHSKGLSRMRSDSNLLDIDGERKAAIPEMQQRPAEPQPPEQQGNCSNELLQHTLDQQHKVLEDTISTPTSTLTPSRSRSRNTSNLSLDTTSIQLHTNARGSDAKSDVSAFSENSATIVGRTFSLGPCVEVVMKSVELESLDAVLRNRRSNRSTHSASSSRQLRRLTASEDNKNNTTPPEGTGAGPLLHSSHRRLSFSSVRDHVPAGIITEPCAVKIYVDESSPGQEPLKHVPVMSERQAEEGSSSSGTDEDDDFDWEEDKIYEDKEKDLQANAESIAMMEGDVCCQPLHRRVHPWVIRLVKNAFIIVCFLIPKFILRHVHTHHQKTVVLIEDGKPYMAVVIGNHLSYFLIQFLIMALFKIIHKFGSVKVKIILETHDGLVPHIARSVWLFVLIAFWVVFVHYPTCAKAKSGIDFTKMAEGVDMECRRWIFWWVHRCLWGLQAMNLLYILKRYTMQILSDRFEQDNSKFVELNFQGHVLDGLQKIKPHRQQRIPGLQGHHYRWAEKSTSWLASSTHQGGKSPNQSRPSSSKAEKPPTASLVDGITQKRSTWELLKNSFQRRTEAKGTSVEKATSPAGSIGEVCRDHELEPQEFVKMSKKRKSKLIHSLRNKPIEVRFFPLPRTYWYNNCC
ncbi:hypothetical protein BC939DRAFT_302794 [Gamsiella multidivaricata]|uniref:uncharacterized protein n=1 Tax=Gamsiella multidivaricata TaxID=101098 RepID=UPI00221EB4EC|nr:uncharacterized protein BC939DRAFT_302794 [Gamsiella multidivaricata]KAI7830219.1 hypothetical protein BC939DRAFT_302794 [Gamsiella multidivaricata]